MKKSIIIAGQAVMALSAVINADETRTRQRPNIIIVLADDLGYGDAHCFDPEYAKVPTPNIDALAKSGLMFTDAHAGAALCTPSRYGLMTGRHSWRSPLRSHVLSPYGSPLIAAERLTLPEMLRQNGYRTGCIGKWHLGWNWPLRQPDGSVERASGTALKKGRSGEPVFNEPITDGPTTRGFDEYFGVDVPNYPPYTFIRNDRMTVEPTEQMKMPGKTKWPMAPGWKFDGIMPAIVKEAEAFIGRQSKEKPFFLYLPFTSPHEPVAPSEAFRGKSGISDVADFIMETDAALGRVVAALEKYHFADNTLVVFTSDNGHAGYTGMKPFVDAGHRVAGPYRGYKCNISEGGHRVPMIAAWPGVIAPDTRTEQLACLTDWMATCAAIVGAELPPDSAVDSVTLMPLLQGKNVPVRDDLVIQSYSADVLCIRQGKWKLSVCAGDGAHRPWCTEKGVPNDISDKEALAQGRPPIQLYDVVADPGETKNLCHEQPERVKELLKQIQKQIADGRSTPGPKQANDAPVKLVIPE